MLNTRSKKRGTFGVTPNASMRKLFHNLQVVQRIWNSRGETGPTVIPKALGNEIHTPVYRNHLLESKPRGQRRRKEVHVRGTRVFPPELRNGTERKSGCFITSQGQGARRRKETAWERAQDLGGPRN